MNRCEKCGAYLDPGEKCDCEAEEMNNTIDNTMVMVTRAEYEELIKLRMIKQNILKHFCRHDDGSIPSFTCVETELFKSLFPNELGADADV